MQRSGRIKIVVGTRGSQLAVIQTEQVLQALAARWAHLRCEVKIIKTRGDDEKTAIKDIRAGRKGLFTGAIERELLENQIDLAVHSAKDLPSNLAPNTEIAAVLPRSLIDDVLVATTPCDINSVPKGGIVATGSVRRQHQLRWKRPDLEIVDLRGNVPTRLRKLAASQWHAVILAGAGLKRLGLDPDDALIKFEGNELWAGLLPRDIFVPAGGQGIIALQIRSDNELLRDLVDAINHFDTRLALRAEREFLRLLQADCNQPVGVLATIDGTAMTIQAQIFDIGATVPREALVGGASENAEKLAVQLLQRLEHEQKRD
jgi:hydroxymethylbilane synthase